MAESSRWPHAQRALAVATLILAFGFALRLFHVDFQGLRGDEGFSALTFARPFAEVWQAMVSFDPNPPLYYFILHNWMLAAGNSELSLRWPSVLAGVITIAVTYRWGYRLLGQGRAPALLTVVSPYLIWHAQDARAYSLLTALAFAAAWQTWEAARGNRLRNWLAAGILWWLALCLHYLAALPLIATGLALVLAPATRRRWLPALGMAAGVGLAFLPVVLPALQLLAGQNKSWIPPISLGPAVAKVLTVFSVGTPGAGGTPTLQAIGGQALGILLVLGLVTLFRRNLSAGIWLAALGLGIPALAWLVSIARPIFIEQYLITALPGLLLLATGGLTVEPARRAESKLPGAVSLVISFLIALLALGGLSSLFNYYFNPDYSKSPNWRGIVTYLTETARPGELVVLNLPDPAFYYYYHGPMPVEASPPDVLKGDTAEVDAQLQGFLAQYHHLRFFNSPSPFYDPNGFVGQWLTACCEKTDDIFLYRFHIQTYDTPAGSLAARQPYPIEFAGGLRLTGFRVLDASPRPGAALHLTLYWTTSRPVSRSYKVFTHLLAADGFNLAGSDNLPNNNRQPTDGWEPGADVIDPHEFALDANMLPGEYAIEVGLYDLKTGERLSGKDEAGVQTDHFRLPVTITIR